MRRRRLSYEVRSLDSPKTRVAGGNNEFSNTPLAGREFA